MELNELDFSDSFPYNPGPNVSTSMDDPSSDFRKVLAVRVVVHQDGSFRDGESANHWSLFLMLPDHTTIRVNFKAWPPCRDGRLEWNPKDYKVPKSAIRCWDYHFVRGVTARDVYNLLIAKGRDRYIMAEDRTGCRWWV